MSQERSAIRRWLFILFDFLLPGGLQVSGLVNFHLAILMWTIAGVVAFALILTWPPVAEPLIRWGRAHRMTSSIVIGFLGAAIFIGGWHLLLNYYSHAEPQPRVSTVKLVAPSQTYHLRWAPLIELHPYMAPEPQSWESAANHPISFKLKNLGANPVQDVRLEWSFENGGNTMQMILNSPYTRRYSPTVNGKFLNLSQGNYMLSLALTDREMLEVDYLIASSTSDHVDEITMPEHFARAFKMRMVATQERVLKSTMPLIQDRRTPGPTIIVDVSWGPSRARTTLLYRIRSEVRVIPSDVGVPGLLNISQERQTPQDLRAYVTFSVEGYDVTGS